MGVGMEVRWYVLEKSDLGLKALAHADLGGVCYEGSVPRCQIDLPQMCPFVASNTDYVMLLYAW